MLDTLKLLTTWNESATFERLLQMCYGVWPKEVVYPIICYVQDKQHLNVLWLDVFNNINYSESQLIINLNKFCPPTDHLILY